MCEPNRKYIFATYFPNCDNIHLVKDVGKIPYVLQRYFGYDSYLICVQKAEFPYLKTEVPGLKLLYVDQSSLNTVYPLKHANHLLRNIFIHLQSIIKFWIPFCLAYGKHIDVLQLYHYSKKTIILGLSLIHI